MGAGGKTGGILKRKHEPTEVSAVDGAPHGQRFEHRHHARLAGGPPVVRKPEVVVRSQVEHALRTVG